jgi:uncharacterized protein YlxW (UPF0749 family)
MQTERVTFLTTPDHKAALDAFASGSGRSVGHVLREAASQYIARPADSSNEDEEALAALVPEVEAAVADMKRTISEMRADIERTCAAVDAVLGGEKP